MAEGTRRRRGTRNGILDSWQNILNETKDFVDDRIDGLRDHGRDDDLADDVEELKEAVTELGVKLDQLVKK